MSGILFLKNVYLMCLKRVVAGHWWLTPVILAVQEAEIGRIAV
jgi:hypothetical protein